MTVRIAEKVGASLAVVFWRQRRCKPNNVAPGDDKFGPSFHRDGNITFVKTFSQSVNRNSQDMMKKPVADVVILQTFLSSLYHNMFRLMPMALRTKGKHKLILI
jgi:hypothetical protein